MPKPTTKSSRGTRPGKRTDTWYEYLIQGSGSSTSRKTRLTKLGGDGSVTNSECPPSAEGRSQSKKGKAVARKRKKYNRAAKGSKFERDLCRQLSLWWSDGKRDDVFWRASQSGGRAKFRGRRGLQTHGQ